MIQFLQDPDGHNLHTTTPDDLPTPVQAWLSDHVAHYSSIKRWCIASVNFQGTTLRTVGGGSDARYALQIPCVGLVFQLHVYRLALGPPGLKWGGYAYRATYDLHSAINVFGCYRIEKVQEPWAPFNDQDQIST
jgi:hypothetical protein